ncbi:hypothetical protein P8452_13930 [Trifolium repens]|nr:hypothetical protein P8452_13930 [Trifolium repens]
MAGGGRENQSFLNYPGRYHDTYLYRGRSVCKGERENSMCRPIFPMPPHLDVLNPMPWQAEAEKIKVFRIAPGGVTPPPCILGGTCAQGERENSMCRPISPTPPHLDALSPVPWQAGVEKIKVFRITTEGVTIPTYIVVGVCAQGER